MNRSSVIVGLACAACLACAPFGARAHGSARKVDVDGVTAERAREMFPRYFQPSTRGAARTEALPDVFGPGAVLRAGNLYMKVTNWGANGNPFTNLSNDPGGHWPGASGIEYLNFIRLAVGAVNPLTTDPVARRRVSYSLEWRPKTLDPVDKIYRAYDGLDPGKRYVNDDGDFEQDFYLGRQQRIDEDFQDGRDNDLDGRIDEDYGALGQEMFSLTMWDNTIEAMQTVFNEQHVPIGLECRERAWAYSGDGFQDFNVMEYEIFNRSGHTLDSLIVGFTVDMDAGPVQGSSYWLDDVDLPRYPTGSFTFTLGNQPGSLPDPLRIQAPHDPAIPMGAASGPLCSQVSLSLNGFSIADDDGDAGRTTGIPSFLLIAHTLDPLGTNGPRTVGWRALRSFTALTPFAQGGSPTTDQERFGFLVSSEQTNRPAGAGGRGDYVQLCSVGPWRNVPDGGSVVVTVAIAVAPGTFQDAVHYPQAYQQYLLAAANGNAIAARTELMERFPSVGTALAAQIAYEGVHEVRDGMLVTDYHGRETPLRSPIGGPLQQFEEYCPARNPDPRIIEVTDRAYSWADFDCSYCTGVWNYPTRRGLFHRTWKADSPPPSPNLNLAQDYHFTDNPQRRVNPSGDHAVVLAWDNLSEYTPDPERKWLDFRGYRVWKVSDWTRPAGSAGPGESDWKLLKEFRLFDYESPITRQPIPRNYTVDPSTGEKQCPLIFAPNYAYTDSITGAPRRGKLIPMCLDRGDLWDQQGGQILKPDTSFRCVNYPSCDSTVGCVLGRDSCSATRNQRAVHHYPIGRYQMTDTKAKNGFVYFYSVTAFDSTQVAGVIAELSSKRRAVEAEGVIPQSATRAGRQVWVVPNPYRGYATPSGRPSSWDLIPNAGDPTGTHIDFMGLPAGPWTIKIFTVAGDLVQTLHSSDPANKSLRAAVRQGGTLYPGYNRQQDSGSDGEAAWNLISRNGQDIASGIYLFTVESQQGTQRGRFVVIR